MLPPRVSACLEFLFLSGDLKLWPMILTVEINLEISVTMKQHVKYLGQRPFRSKVIVRAQRPTQRTVCSTWPVNLSAAIDSWYIAHVSGLLYAQLKIRLANPVQVVLIAWLIRGLDTVTSNIWPTHFEKQKLTLGSRSQLGNGKALRRTLPSPRLWRLPNAHATPSLSSQFVGNRLFALHRSA